MNKTIHAQSGHTLFVESVSFESLPENIKNNEYSKGYTQFYVVKNRDSTGIVFMYLAKGLPTSPKEIVVFYPNGGFWSSFGNTFKEAIDGAQRDGWMHA